MMWAPVGTPVDADRFGVLSPVDVLYDFDGPRIFTLTDTLGDLLLAYQCAEGAEAVRFLVVPADAKLVSALLTGSITLREALSQPWAWIVEQAFSEGVLQSWRVDVETLPADALPRPDTYLSPEHEPIFSVRLLGEGLDTPAGVSASVVRRAVDGASQALKAIVDFVAERSQTLGRPLASVRRLYDLPVQQFRFASFEVAFSSPPDAKEPGLFSTDQADLEAVGDILQRGLEWATGDRETEIEVTGEWATLLDALRRLVPPQQGIVSEVHVGGRLVGRVRRPFVLNRDVATRVKRAREYMLTEHSAVKLEGFIREFDKDKQTFTLRNVERAWRCAINEELYDDAWEAFTDNIAVAVLGQESKSRGVTNVLAIEPLLSSRADSVDD